MRILELRVLPPLAIGRLGASEIPLEAFELAMSSENPTGFRRIEPQTSFALDIQSGEIERAYTPDKIIFKDRDTQSGVLRIRPVAPFLELFARTELAPDELRPLDLNLLKEAGAEVSDLTWSVAVGNIKVYRRTGNPDDKIQCRIETIRDHARHALLGSCKNFLPDRHLPLGFVQFVKPTPAFPQIRFRFTPAAGRVYGSSRKRRGSVAEGSLIDDPVIDRDELVLYDESKGWRGYRESGDPAVPHPTYTNPGQIFAGYSDGTDQVSWGYLDDECDGNVSVSLSLSGGVLLEAHAHIGAGPPSFAPDTLPLRVVSDELEQILFGPSVEEREVQLDQATELVLRALESVRLMNTAVMNGNATGGRLNIASTMVRQDTNDFERYYEPIAAPGLVDEWALRALHERVFSTLAAGGATWFAQALRKPEEIGDLSAQARRKMPAMMRGADGRTLTLTRRQIDLVTKVAASILFKGDSTTASERKP